MAMAAACERYGTTLATAALQFSVRQPRVHSTVVGVSKVERLSGLLDAVGAQLPQDLWDELDALVPSPDTRLDASPEEQ